MTCRPAVEDSGAFPCDRGINLAGAYGNRTHQEPLARPLTGFEDQAGHQDRSLYRGRFCTKRGIGATAVDPETKQSLTVAT